jgi:hypothetical protein
MKMIFTEEEQAFVDAFNAKADVWIKLKNFLESNILSAAGLQFKTDLETYLKANMDQWVDLQTSTLG